MKRYFDTPTRADFALQHFRGRLSGTVLDVGAGGSADVFRAHLGDRYTAVDISGTRARPDVVCDFEREPLPFPDASFDTVLCFDVLEHVDSPHKLFAQCARVARHSFVLSLPNNWAGMLADVIAGRNFSHRSGYGLPIDEPPLGHRHKWFFNWEEAEEFVAENASRNGWHVSEIVPVYERGTSGVIRVPPSTGVISYPGVLGVRAAQVRARNAAWWLPFLLVKYGVAVPLSWAEEIVRQIGWGIGRRRYENVFCRQLWAVLEKPMSRSTA